MKKIKKGLEKAQKEMGLLGKEAKKFIKKNPEKSTAAAASVGAFLGGLITYLLEGKKKKKK